MRRRSVSLTPDRSARPSVIRLAAAALSVLCFAVRPAGARIVGPGYTTTPSIAYGELYRDVELAAAFPDSKTFPDMIPDATPAAILDEYRDAKGSPAFDLATFVQRHFTGPTPPGPTVNPAPPGRRLLDYVMGLWPVLQQEATSVPPYSALQPLPYPYVVPGGRFREVYYWDSYFTILGLEDDGQHQLALDLSNDFAFELGQFGKVPNGNRSYYLSRSQPPFFSLMVKLIGSADGNGTEAGYLPQMQQEWDFWTDGADELLPGKAGRNSVRLADGTLLNRYWDARDAPRDESYKEDVETAAGSGRPPALVYRNLRAAAESGWDFSSRWFTDGKTLGTVRTLSILPVARGRRAGGGLSGADAEPGRGDPAPDVGCAGRRVLGLFVGDRRVHPRDYRRDALSAFPEDGDRGPGAGRCGDCRAEIARRGWASHDPRTERPAMGCTQWVGAAAMDRRDRSAQLRVRATGS